MNTTLRNKTALVLAVMGVAACASYDKDVADTPVHEVQTGSVAAQQTSQEYRDHDVEEEESDLPDDVAPPSAPAEPASERGPAPDQVAEAKPAPARLDTRTKGEVHRARRHIESRKTMDAAEPLFVPGESGVSTEGYTDYGVNQATSTTKDRFSTFSIDVDRASYSNVRRFLMDGQLPPADAVRNLVVAERDSAQPVRPGQHPDAHEQHQDRQPDPQRDLARQDADKQQERGDGQQIFHHGPANGDVTDGGVQIVPLRQDQSHHDGAGQAFRRLERHPLV